jgi:hypothetical protein
MMLLGTLSDSGIAAVERRLRRRVASHLQPQDTPVKGTRPRAHDALLLSHSRGRDEAAEGAESKSDKQKAQSKVGIGRPSTGP